MAPAHNVIGKKEFASFAVLDFETSNFPDNRYNKVGITELSVYGIAISEFKSLENETPNPPELPRVLHKLTLMINPMMAIDPGAERVSGLDNFMLEAESKFNENAGNTLLGFLRHLQQPVCMVAHNGYSFDFPILKYALERASLNMIDNLYVLDSLRAFHDIDELRKVQLETLEVKIDKEETNLTYDIEDIIKSQELFDACSQNETTPKRQILTAEAAAIKRKRLKDADCENEVDEENTTPKVLKSCRKLNFGEITPKCSTNKNRIESRKKWYPPAGLYKLPNLFLRTFSRDPVKAHHAEADVKTLTQLMLHYGLDFVDYAEAHAIPFENIPKLGRPNYI